MSRENSYYKHKYRELNKAVEGLIQVYTDEIEKAEEAARIESFCNSYCQGKLAAFEMIIRDLKEVLDE